MSGLASFRRLRLFLPLIAILPGLVAGGLSSAVAEVSADASPNPGRPWVWPLAPRPAVVDPFDPPDTPYGAGNRGVDLAGAVGQPVLAIGAGVVTFAGVVGGRGVVVVSHGELRSTYEPVSATVAVGETVRTGQPVGVLAAVGSPCAPSACLHLGVLQATRYVDPLSLLGDPPIRLKPVAGDVDWPAAPPRSAVVDSALAAAGYAWSIVR